MFDIGWSELLVIVIVLIVVVGPKDLPRLMRTFGHYAGKLRRAAADFQRQFDQAMREAELDEMRKAVEDMRSTTSVDIKSLDEPVMLPKAEAAPPRKSEPPTKGSGKSAKSKTKQAPKRAAACLALAAAEPGS